MISRIKEFADNYPKTIVCKIEYKIAKLEDQEEALDKPKYAYLFASAVKGADIEKCQEIACQESWYAFLFARDIPGADIEKCQEVVCKSKSAWHSYLFALHIPGANVEKCQEIACIIPQFSYMFARDILGANIEKCRKFANKNNFWKKEFEEYFGK